MGLLLHLQQMDMLAEQQLCQQVEVTAAEAFLVQDQTRQAQLVQMAV